MLQYLGISARAERDILGAALRRALGGSARALRAANHLLQPLPPLDQRRVWDRIIDALTEAYDGHIQMIDGTSVRVHHSAATLKKSGPDRCQGRSRGGLTTKIHALTNRAGLPIRLAITPGQTHDIQPAHAMLEGIGSGAMLLADKAYDANAIRSQLHQQGVFANIPARGPQGADRVQPVSLQGAQRDQALLQQAQVFPPNRDPLCLSSGSTRGTSLARPS